MCPGFRWWKNSEACCAPKAKAGDVSRQIRCGVGGCRAPPRFGWKFAKGETFACVRGLAGWVREPPAGIFGDRRRLRMVNEL